MMERHPEIHALPVPANLLGESPLWHPQEQVLNWCDIPGRHVHRFDPASRQHRQWLFHTEVACCAACAEGGLLLALRDGLWNFNPADGGLTQLSAAPYAQAIERFNDGKVDAQGRFWCGTIYEPRDTPSAGLYRWANRQLQLIAGNITVSNGLAWSPSGRTLDWADTPIHVVYACDFDPRSGTLSHRRVFARFAPRDLAQGLAHYGGRPDGAAVDAEGCYWVAMFEGGCLQRFTHEGVLLQILRLPVRCPTMPCFGGPDLRSLFITPSRENRPAPELADMPLSGQFCNCASTCPASPPTL